MEEKNIGDKVWWASCGVKQVTTECPVCFTQRYVTLILGNGEQIKTPCDYCVRGFESPSGYVQEYQKVSDVKEVTITAKEVRETEKGRSIEYRSENYCLYASDNFFETKEEAEIRVKQMIKEDEDSEVARLAHKKKSNQTHYSWSVGYYRKKIKDAQRDLDFYSRKVEETPS